MDVEEEALQRLTALRLRILQDKVRAEQQGAAEQQNAQFMMAQQMQHQHQLQHRSHMEQMQRALEAKRAELRQLDDTARDMREQLDMRLAAGTATRGGDLGNDVGGGGASKLDAILAQTLQMQTMFMAHMAAQGMGGGVYSGGSMLGAGEGQMSPVPLVAHGGFGGAMSGQMGGGMQQVGGGMQMGAGNNVVAGVQQQAAHRQQKVESLPAMRPPPQAAYAEPGQDVNLLNQLQSMVEKLDHADAEAHQVAEAALERARAQDTARDAGVSPGKKVKDGQTLENEEDEVEAEIEDGDEIQHDEMATFHDISFSWIKKVVKHVIVNVLLEADINLEICTPFKGSMFKRGITQQDIDSRIIKLAVRCKGIVKALSESCTKEGTPEVIITFLQRLVAHRQKYPGPKVGATLAGVGHTARPTPGGGNAGGGVHDKKDQRHHIFQQDGR